jgi:hypothetical protein
MGTWIGLLWLRIGAGGRRVKGGDELMVSIKCGEFVT